MAAFGGSGSQSDLAENLKMIEVQGIAYGSDRIGDENDIVIIDELPDGDHEFIFESDDCKVTGRVFVKDGNKWIYQYEIQNRF